LPLFQSLSQKKGALLQRISENILFLQDFFVTLPSRWRNYSVSAKKETSFFVLLSTFRNFAEN